MLADEKNTASEKTGGYLVKFYLFIFLYIAISVLIVCLSVRFNGAGTRVSILNGLNLNVPAKKTVIIDAGHGGIDGGAVGVGGVEEKDLNLAISKKLERLFKTSDIEVIMTRSDDRLLSDENAARKKSSDLINRAAIAQKYPDALFISIHMNKFTEEKYSGMQVFYSSGNRYSAALADVIKKINAEYLQPENNRRVKRANGIYVLENIKNTAVLVECGFLSNRAEAALLSDDGYQNKVARVIFISVLEYLKESE